MCAFTEDCPKLGRASESALHSNLSLIKLESEIHFQVEVFLTCLGTCTLANHPSIVRNVPKLALPCGWLQVGTGPLDATSQNHSCSKFSAFRPLTTTSPVSQSCRRQCLMCVCVYLMKYALNDSALATFQCSGRQAIIINSSK